MLMYHIYRSKWEYFVVVGESIEEVKAKAQKEAERRGWVFIDCWSERIN